MFVLCLNSEFHSNPIVYYRKSDKFLKNNKAGSDVTMPILQELLKNPQAWKFTWLSDTPITPYYSIKDPTDPTLIFESRFNSGNLDLAIKVDDNYYKLIMQNDSNTKGNCQWFYFKVSNTKQKATVHFEIMNFVFPNSGQKILVVCRGYENINIFSKITPRR